MLSALEEALCFHEALRTLGFEAHELFLVLDMDSVYVTVRTQGKDFHIGCGKSGYQTPEDAAESWTKLLAWWRCASTHDDARNALYQKSFVAKTSVGLVTCLISRSIHIPKSAEEVSGVSSSRQMMN